MNPILDRFKNQRHGQKSERRVARKLKARQTPGSGSKPRAKSDMWKLMENKAAFRIEAKSTIKNSISIKKAWLDKITREALERGQKPSLTLSFVTGSGEKQANGDWVLVPMWVLEELCCS